MKKILFSAAAIFLMLISGAKGQSTAMDFKQTDCDGVDHHLFSELDAGNVIILDYVMLNCAPCVGATNALVALTAPYELTHPGRVRIYSYAFLDSYTCEQIIQWKRDFNYSHPAFSQGEQQVSYYGGMGMPTIVITGTDNHKVFYNGIGYTPDNDALILAAIDSALLYNPTGVDEVISSNDVRIYPTLFTDKLYIEASKEYAGAEIVIFDSFGRKVLSSFVPESGRASILSGGLSKGLYIARLQTSAGISEGIRLIRQ
jgi:hypothetical protein